MLKRNHHVNNPKTVGRSVSGAGATASSIGAGCPGPIAVSSPRRMPGVLLLLLFLASVSGAAVSAFGAPADGLKMLAATPPMGWNDWDHYQCGVTAETIVSNAKALVTTGLAARGYQTVTIDYCWMQKGRDSKGNLQPDPVRFPQGIKTVASAVHALGLKFGIYEDSGYATCDGLAGSGQPKGGGKDHFFQDARLFASWGVDYLKLDACNVYVPPGSSKDAAFRKAYARESAALKSVDRPIVFSESAPAYFQGTPEWYDVLSWVRYYGQLWREGSDMANYHAKDPDAPRFPSVLWNYAYNLPLGRFQKPGNWNDPDFIIGGDSGLSLAESRSQLALWSMMSAPLILSSDVAKLSPQAIAILGKRAVIAIDQDPLGRMATLVRRSNAMDVLFKPLAAGDAAVAVLNRSAAPVRVSLRPADFGYAANSGCRLEVRNLWNDKRQSAISALEAEIAPHDTAIWRVQPSAHCGRPSRTGAIIMTTNPDRHHRNIDSYSRCLTAPGQVEACSGTRGESWVVTSSGALRSLGGRCLGVAHGKPVMEACRAASTQRWRYTLEGNLKSAQDHQCLSATGPASDHQSLTIEPCGHNQQNQIWSLPN